MIHRGAAKILWDILPHICVPILLHELTYNTGAVKIIWGRVKKNVCEFETGVPNCLVSQDISTCPPSHIRTLVTCNSSTRSSIGYTRSSISYTRSSICHTRSSIGYTRSSVSAGMFYQGSFCFWWCKLFFFLGIYLFGYLN